MEAWLFIRGNIVRIMFFPGGEMAELYIYMAWKSTSTLTLALTWKSNLETIQPFFDHRMNLGGRLAASRRWMNIFLQIRLYWHTMFLVALGWLRWQTLHSFALGWLRWQFSFLFLIVFGACFSGSNAQDFCKSTIDMWIIEEELCQKHIFQT